LGVQTEMKENLSARKSNQLNLTGEEGMGVSRTGGGGSEEESFHNELKTPTGQSTGQYITPTSNVNMLPQKKHGQNAPTQFHHQSRLGGQGMVSLIEEQAPQVT